MDRIRRGESGQVVRVRDESGAELLDACSRTKRASQHRSLKGGNIELGELSESALGSALDANRPLSSWVRAANLVKDAASLSEGAG